MKNIINSLAKAKSKIATLKLNKEWENDYSHYNYFTPEQVNSIVQEACNEFKLLTKFDLKRNEFGLYGTLTVYDLESGESLVFEGASELPDIKATVSSQRYGWLMTYLERYLKSTAFWIVENGLDLDTTENTKKVAGATKSEEKKEVKWFNKPELENLKKNTDYLKKFKTSDELLQDIKKLGYSISDAMKREVADVRAKVE